MKPDALSEHRLRREIDSAEQERGRWARELHDETLQGLGALRVLLASGLRVRSEGALIGAVRDAITELDLQIESVRAMIVELRPAALDEIGLDAAIQSLVGRTESAAGMAVATDLTLGGPDGVATRLGREIETVLYRLVQEALTNVVKHANAENVSVRVARTNGTIEVIVHDDGVGFDVEAKHDGFGLLGMSERIEMAGGSFEVASTPGHGATLRAVFPVPPTQ